MGGWVVGVGLGFGEGEVDQLRGNLIKPTALLKEFVFSRSTNVKDRFCHNDIVFTKNMSMDHGIM